MSGLKKAPVQRKSSAAKKLRRQSKNPFGTAPLRRLFHQSGVLRTRSQVFDQMSPIMADMLSDLVSRAAIYCKNAGQKTLGAGHALAACQDLGPSVMGV